ncbi:hypothetical protein M9434_004060 [Picochlorum sp. BPE23]|nr:hypothetical protein M9434_004060 [Picochlorum sp. BPE23]
MICFTRIQIGLVLFFLGLHQVVVQAQQAGVVVDSQDDANVILDAHNAYRRAHGAPSLTWSRRLAKDAAAWGEECRWEHDGSNKDQGENLYASFGYPENTLYQNAAKSWYDEVALYDFDNPENSNFKDVGHFTQMVWKKSREIGCARVRCRDGQNGPFSVDGEWLYVVCRYSPPGNMMSSGNDAYKYFKENVLKAGEEPEPEPEPQAQCNGKTKTVKLKIHGKGKSCDNGAGQAGAQAVSDIINGKFSFCKLSFSCIQKPKDVSYVIVRTTVSRGTEKEVMALLTKAVKDKTFYDRWDLKRVKGKKYKVCLNKKKGC